ncbi:MAG: hypothetical protein FJ264_02740 [Planctomycetes bacterium]|nr:hypothetical protein [Planctomycetota bacterium]
MYKKILIPIDNSKYSNYCIDLGIAISTKFGSQLVGCHVYDATLHQKRFRDMEEGLPEKYQDEKELQRQRNLHASLINQGLKMISESYLDVFKEKCKNANVPHNEILLEGKNYYEIIREVRRGGYDLVIIGALGLAAVNENLIGSVCERVVRRIKTDVLIVKRNGFGGKIVVAVDGSMQSLAGVKSAISFSRSFNMKLDAVSIYDPHYHRVAFGSIAKVLSEEAGKIFRFKEQETLHEEIIDKGLAKIYQNHLDSACNIAKREGVEISSILLDGKPFDQILRYLKNYPSSLLIVGRTGIHNTNSLDLGSTTENLLRLAPCNIMLTGGNIRVTMENPVHSGVSSGKKTDNVNERGNYQYEEGVAGTVASNKVVPEGEECGEEDSSVEHVPLIWSNEAHEQTERIPSFIRGIVRKRIEKYAQENGHREITEEIVNEVKSQYMGKDLSHIH